jgi:hypothetical protein
MGALKVIIVITMMAVMAMTRQRLMLLWTLPSLRRVECEKNSM